MKEDSPYYGFVLVTTDPMMKDGEIGSAFELIEARLEKAQWPLYERTRYRSSIIEGARVSFYVAGTRQVKGHIVATARVSQVKGFRYGQNLVDPESFLTDRPHTVLELGTIARLREPIDLRNRIQELTICPENPKNWGSVLQGGVTALGEADWKQLFRNAKPIEIKGGARHSEKAPRGAGPASAKIGGV